MKLVGHRCTRLFFPDVKFSSPYRESTGVQNSANIFSISKMQNHGVRDKTYPFERSVTRLGELQDENKKIKILNDKIFFTVSLPERYISFARIILFFSDRGDCSPPPTRTPMY